jgi:sugar transferase (PEP-CTERM/EpsH1 system associated)
VSGNPSPLVAHIIFRLDYGGLENGLVNLINRIPEDRFRHAIICLAGFSDFRQRIRRTDVQIYSLDKRPGKDLGVYVRLWRLLRRLKPAIVHTRNLGTVDLQWVAAASGVRRRVHGEHGWDAADVRGNNPRNLFIRRVCRSVIQRYVAMSRDLAAWLQSAVHVPASRITQIYNGVDTQRFSHEGSVPSDLPWSTASDRPFVFGTVGRLDAVKNQLQLLDAFASLDSDSRDRCRLLLVGNGAMEATLKERAAQLGMMSSVWFAGARNDIPELMRAMDVFVLPSLNEGISNTILEAMASQLPVIAAAVGGNPELIANEATGILYESVQVASLAQAMLRYYRDPQLARRHGTAGRERVVDCFSLNSMVAGYLRVYGELLA